MPDMAYSRAYETYAMTDEKKAELAKQGIHFSNMPVPGTVKRGDKVIYHIPADTTGEYARSAAMKNPLTAALDSAELGETARIFNINCAICHGAKLDGNGPLWKDGSGPYPAAPRNLMDAYTKGLSDGTIYHAITYGKNKMGSYAAQLNPEQRWKLVQYIRLKQGPAAAPAATAAAPAAAKDTAKAGK